MKKNKKNRLLKSVIGDIVAKSFYWTVMDKIVLGYHFVAGRVETCC